MKPGERIAIHYRVDALIGQGGMGIVYRCCDLRTGGRVAIKALRPEIVDSNPDLLTRFIREAEILRQLNHPNIVRVLDTLEENGQYYIVMDYVAGGDLADLLMKQDSLLPIQRVLTLTLELADALTRAHYLKVIHRDLKPANVLLADDGTPRLTDFGVAAIQTGEHLTDVGTALGTLDYMPPEALKGEPGDTRGDIWSFGALLFELLTRQHPFAGSVLSNILTEPPADLEYLRPDAPLALVDLVYRMLEKDRQARIPSIRLVGAELEVILYQIETQEPVESPRVKAILSTDVFRTPAATPSAFPSQIPADATPFVGRDTEVAALLRVLQEPATRLVTVLGPGGMGKTRLAVEVARQISERHAAQPVLMRRYGAGVFFVGLAALRSSENMASTIATTLGCQFASDKDVRQQLLGYLREKHLLLVLDNFEHVLEGAALVADIVQQAAQVTVLVTSRVRLNVRGETLFMLEGMEFPAWETPADALRYDAVRLFLSAAQRIRPAFELANDDLRYLSRICRLVYGMPLGIELAASWVGMLTLPEIADEISQGLDFLETQMADAPERHRSIQAVFDYSWRLLSAEEQAIFMRLAVFRGGFTRAAAQAVTGAGLRQLLTLMDKSLLKRDADSGRFSVHELLRQYAEAALDASSEREAIHNAHCDYYAQALYGRIADLKNSRQQEAMRDILIDLENVRTAWDWACAHQDATALDRMVESLGWFCTYRAAYRNGVGFMERGAAALAGLESPSARQTRAYLLAWYAEYVSYGFSEQSRAETMVREAVAILREGQNLSRLAFALRVLAMSTVTQSSVRELSEESLRLYQQAGDEHGHARILQLLGYLNYLKGYSSTNEGIAYMQESLEIRRRIGDEFGIIGALSNVAAGGILTGDWDAVEAGAAEVIQRARRLGYVAQLPVNFRNLAAVAFVRGDWERTQSIIQEGLALSREYEMRNNVQAFLFQQSIWHLLRGEYRAALEMSEQSAALALKIAGKDEDQFELCYPLVARGCARCGLGDPLAGADDLFKSLRWMVDPPAANIAQRLALIGVASVFVAREQPEQAAELLACVLHDRLTPAWWTEREPLTQRLLTSIRQTAYPDAWAAGSQIHVPDLLRRLANA
jgi:predicted ATPase